MIVFKIDIQSAFARPAESDPVIPSHAHRPAFRFALQAVETKACDVHVLRLPRYFQQLQDAHALPDMIGADPACLTCAVDLFKPLMPEATDHSFSVKRIVDNCQLNSCLFGDDKLVCVPEHLQDGLSIGASLQRCRNRTHET